MRKVIEAIIIQECFEYKNKENFINSVCKKTSGLIPKSEEEIREVLLEYLKNKSEINALDINNHLCNNFDIQDK